MSFTHNNTPRWLISLLPYFGVVLSLLSFTPGAAGQTIHQDFQPLSAAYGTAKQFPSLTPVTFLRIAYGGPLQENDQHISRYRISDVQSPATWIVRKVTSTLPAATISTKEVSPSRVDLTTTQNVAYLYFANGVFQKGDQIIVGIRAYSLKGRDATGHPIYDTDVTEILNTKQLGDNSPTAILADDEPDPYTLKLDPGQVQNQSLLDGSQKSVDHFKIDLDVPSLASTGSNGARIYLSSKNLLSTQKLDAATEIEVKIGAERSLTRRWYVPGSLDAEILSNQAFSNSSNVVSANVTTNLPWGWTRHTLLGGHLLNAPVSPDLTFAVQYEHRLKIDDRAPLSHANKNNLRFMGQLAWNPVYLFTGKQASPDNLSLEMLAKGYLFPDEKATNGAKVGRQEGQVEVSLVIPLGGVAKPNETLQKAGVTDLPTLATEVLPFLKKVGDGPATRFRIKFSGGADEANGYAHSSQWTFSFEAVQ